MVSFRDIFEKGVLQLLNTATENAEFDCGVIFEKAFGKNFSSFRFSDEYLNTPDSESTEHFFEMIKRRSEGYPLQYIVGEWEFFGLPFEVGEGVLIPRQDTETLVEFAISRFKDRKNLRVCDLCAGSGCIGIALEKHLNCKSVVCVEYSDKALGFLQKNAQLNKRRIEILKGNVLDEKFAKSLGDFDLIVSNPPYLTKEDMQLLQKEVSFEPETALYGGDDGLMFYREIVRLWKHNLSCGGMMIFEIGKGQEDEVSQMMIQNGLKNVRYKTDLCGVNRIVCGENILYQNC